MMDRDTLQGYACWAVAATLGVVIAIIIVTGVATWATA
jgi:hypothetical protein